ncbi:MAG: hypothetical protein ABGY75_10615, partial [Gemmataceae bacterium]
MADGLCVEPAAGSAGAHAAGGRRLPSQFSPEEPVSTPEDDLARRLEEAQEILGRLAEKRHPYVDQVGRLMRAVADAGELVNEIGTRWKHDFLEKAKAPDKNNPA